MKTAAQTVVGALIAIVASGMSSAQVKSDEPVNSVRISGCRSLEYADENPFGYGPLKLRQIKGTAKDMHSTPVPGTCVGIFTEPDHRLMSSVETDKNGSFALGTIRR